MTLISKHLREAVYGLSVTALIGLCGCATNKGQTKTQAPTPLAKQAQQRPPAPVIAKSGSKDGTPVEQVQQDSWQQRFIRTVHPSYQVTEEDLAMVQSLDSQAQPLEEAIAMAIVLRTVGTRDFKDQPGFVARDISSPDALQEPAAPIAKQFQDEAKKLGFHFSVWNTLAQNPFLQLPIIYRHADQALQRLGNSPKDRELLTRLIQHRANAWASLLPSEVEPDASPKQSGQTSETPVGQIQIEPPTVGKYSLADLNRGDALLRQAQRFAERGDYKQAIQYATRIAQKDPLYPAASEKIKVFSNQAVQDLRQKAAQAFQSALPVNDRETRVAYLEQARQYLVQALEEFPEADHLGTVRENLAVISQDLDSISEQAR